MSPANLTVAVNLPFLVILTLMVATPFLLVLALKVFLLTLMVIVLPDKALLPDFKVTLIFLTFLTFNVAFLAVIFVAFLTTGGTGFAFTVIFALANDALYSSSPKNEN